MNGHRFNLMVAEHGFMGVTDKGRRRSNAKAVIATFAGSLQSATTQNVPLGRLSASSDRARSRPQLLPCVASFAASWAARETGHERTMFSRMNVRSLGAPIPW